ncbi:MAG: polysaccharide deacetylase family protein [Sedimentisphaerales bacterium]|nr:polysaccharide deacetylase family protein [Sedimentisphaerales bacterium]
MRSFPYGSAIGRTRNQAPIGVDTCLILRYHRVDSLCHDPFQLAVMPHNFERQMQYLAENFNVISMDEVKLRLQTAGPFADRSVAVTFDGGYADVLYIAKEVLETYGIFATVFTPSAAIEKPELFWQDRLEDIFIAAAPRGQLEIEIDNQNYILPLETRRDAFRAFDVLCSILSNRTPAVQEKIITQIRQGLNREPLEPDSHRTMDAAELKKLEEGGFITVGGHTHNCVNLAALPAWQQIDQLKTNKSILENTVGHPVEYFSYPVESENSSTAETAHMLENAGFTLACGASYGTVTAAGPMNRYDLPRVKVGNWNPFTFYKFLEGFFT